MRKRRWLGFALPLLIGAAIWGMPDSEKRHRYDSGFVVGDESEITHREAFIVTNISLADTLAPDFVKMLGIPDVAGVKFATSSHAWSSYFTYRADKRKLFAALQQLPFTFTDRNVDLTVRQISFGELHIIKSALKPEEISNTSVFWTPGDDSRVYEFIKPPFRHTLIITEKEEGIQHRVEFIG